MVDLTIVTLLSMKVAGILDLHELHVWQLTGERTIATVHVRCKNSATYERLAEDLLAFFHEEGIHSLTVQPEFTEVSIRANVLAFSRAHQCPHVLIDIYYLLEIRTPQ